ncbi:hypothetical protein PG994_008925 [Apiospora phragmitis]|uniref:Uncharacterized protein n=1 Tax=Apiospora phragmitis TaxID=2905665 RepID=A0ABR1UIF0_9PEZI
MGAGPETVTTVFLEAALALLADGREEADIALSKLSSDRASLAATLDLKHIEVQAWNPVGKHALDVFDRLRLEPEDDQVIPNAIICLQAYKHSIEVLSVERAKATIARDEAGSRVVQWFETKGINRQMKSNHPENRTLLGLISDILIGADRLQTMESWLCKKHKAPKAVPGSPSFNRKIPWKGYLYSAMLPSLAWWNPSGAMDDALNYFSKTAEYMVNRHYISHAYPLIAIVKIMTDPHKLCLDSGGFDRCLAVVERIGLLTQDFSTQMHLTLAHLKICHPLHPDPSPWLDFLRDIELDPLHSSRFFAPKGEKVNLHK